MEKKAKEQSFKDDVWASDSKTQVNGEVRNTGRGGGGFEALLIFIWETFKKRCPGGSRCTDHKPF